MKILFINTVAGRTAVGQIVDSIASRAIERGHSVYIASGYGKSEVEGVHSIAIGNTIDRYIHALCTRINDSHAHHSLRATSILIDEIVKLKPDVIHIHNIHGYYINMPLFVSFLKKTNIPIYLTLHDLWLLTGHCAYPTATKCTKYANASCCDCDQRNAYPKSFFDFSRRNVKIKQNLFSDFNNLHLVVPSRWMSNIVHESWMKNNPMYIIPNGVDISIFKACDVPQENRVIGVANVWTNDKGLDSFIKLRELLSPKIEILLVGVAKSQQKKLPLGIRSLSYVKNTDLPRLYSSSKATINLSVNEAFGMTIIESMACSTPVISFDNSTPSEIITKESGILVSDGDITAIATAIENIKKVEYKDKCREHVKPNFSHTIMCDKYINLFELTR